MFQSLDVQVGEQKWNPGQHSFSNDLPELVTDSDEEQNLPASSNYQEEESGRLAALLTDSDSGFFFLTTIIYNIYNTYIILSF